MILVQRGDRGLNHQHLGVAMLAAAKRLEFSIPVGEWIANVEALPFLEFIPVEQSNRRRVGVAA